MNKIQKLWKYLLNEGYRFSINAARGRYNNMPDEEYIKRMYRAKMGKELDLAHPKTYNEKLQWLKLHDRKPIYTTMVDKYEAKKFIAEKVGEQHVVPTLGVWDRFEDVDFDALPDQFVLKTTHDSGGVVICRDKSSFDRESARKKLIRSLNRNFYLLGREWPYKDVKPRIIAEQYLYSENGEPIVEYKWYCFDGEPKLCERIYNDAVTGIRTIDGYDEKWNLLEFQEIPRPNSGKVFPKPLFYDEMLEIARTLSKGIPQVRVDFMSCNEELYIGELTFFESSGHFRTIPDSWNEILGSWIKLPGAEDEQE